MQTENTRLRAAREVNQNEGQTGAQTMASPPSVAIVARRSSKEKGAAHDCRQKFPQRLRQVEAMAEGETKKEGVLTENETIFR